MNKISNNASEEFAAESPATQRMPGADKLTLRRLSEVASGIRSRRTDTTTKSAILGRFVINHFLDSTWSIAVLNENIESRVASEKFLIKEIGELLFNLQRSRGFPAILDRLRKSDSFIKLHSTLAEFEIAHMLKVAGVAFEFVIPQGIKGNDYDLDIYIGDRRFCADTKCKLPTTQLTPRTLRHVLNSARKQFPRESQSFIFIRVPDTWFILPEQPTHRGPIYSFDENSLALIDEQVKTFLLGTGRVSSVVLYTRHWQTKGDHIVHTAYVVRQIWNKKNGGELVSLFGDTGAPRLNTSPNWINFDQLSDLAHDLNLYCKTKSSEASARKSVEKHNRHRFRH